MRLRRLLRGLSVAVLAFVVGGAVAGPVNPGYYVVTVYDDPGVVTEDTGDSVPQWYDAAPIRAP